MRFQQAPYRIADVVALLFILHGNTSFGSLAPIIPYRSCKHYLRLETFQFIEDLLDGDQLVFRFNKKVLPYSAIDGDFLLKMGDGIALNISFLFIDKENCGNYFCRSFFPMERTDYTKNQMQYTLLKKEKINLNTGETIVQYDRLTPKTTKKEEG